MAPGRLTKVTIAALALVVAACNALAPIPTATWSPTGGILLPGAVLKYKLIDEFGPIAWCDPDFYPISRDDEQDLAAQRLPEIQADSETFGAIADRLGIDRSVQLGPDEVLAIYREWKLLNAVALTQAEDGLAFDLVTETNPGLGQGVRSQGVIHPIGGEVVVQTQEDTPLTGCPICLSPGTLIDTPSGHIAVQDLIVGDLVWTLDSSGRRVALPLINTGSTHVPSSHRVVHLVLDDGRELWVSPGHSLPDGRSIGELQPGDSVDGALVLTANLVDYEFDSTFDILPGGPTGLYWANGIQVASTLR